MKLLLHFTGSLMLYIQLDPGVFPPPSFDYLINMSDPAETPTYTMVSFYSFGDTGDTEAYAAALQALWRPFLALGRVYVASEGVNAQMAVPTNVIANFQRATETLPLFAGMRMNTDHTMTARDYERARPFKALHIRAREQIVTDGFLQPLDWQRSGSEMPPAEWHAAINEPGAVVLDCRNRYESDVGIFDK
jgi:UPF0176 protein